MVPAGLVCHCPVLGFAHVGSLLLLHGGAQLESASFVLEVVSLDSVLFLRGVTCLGLALLVLGAVSMGSLPPAPQCVPP